MNKKTYIIPTMETINLKMEQSLLQASGVYEQLGNGTQLAPGLDFGTDLPDFE